MNFISVELIFSRCDLVVIFFYHRRCRLRRCSSMTMSLSLCYKLKQYTYLHYTRYYIFITANASFTNAKSNNDLKNVYAQRERDHKNIKFIGWISSMEFKWYVFPFIPLELTKNINDKYQNESELVSKFLLSLDCKLHANLINWVQFHKWNSKIHFIEKT